MSVTQLCARLADLALICFLGLLVWSLPRLPEDAVSHFGRDGPDGWMPRFWFVMLFAGTVLAFEALFRWGIPAMMRRTPPGLMNLPNRSYWLSTPERQLEAYDRVVGLMGPARLFMNAIMLIALHACVQASGVPVLVELPLQWLGFAIGLASVLFTIGTFVWAFRSFRIPPETTSG